MKISMDGKGRYQDNIFAERLWRTVKYEEVYLKAYASVLEAQRGLKTTSGSTTGSGPIRPWATGPRPRCSMGSRMSWKSSPMEGGVHPERGPNHWQERRDSHLTPP